MTTLALALWKDEAGFIISAELVLISTISVLSMVVGLSEIAHAVNQELEDVASAFGAVNQTYRYTGLTGHNGAPGGTRFEDKGDFCDSPSDIIGTASNGESHGNGH